MFCCLTASTARALLCMVMFRSWRRGSVCMSELDDAGVRVLSIRALDGDLEHLGSLTSHMISKVYSCTLVDMHTDPRF